MSYHFCKFENGTDSHTCIVWTRDSANTTIALGPSLRLRFATVSSIFLLSFFFPISADLIMPFIVDTWDCCPSFTCEKYYAHLKQYSILEKHISLHFWPFLENYDTIPTFLKSQHNLVSNFHKNWRQKFFFLQKSRKRIELNSSQVAESSAR